MKRPSTYLLALALCCAPLALSSGCRPSMAVIAPGVTVADAPREALSAEVYHIDWPEGDCAYHAVKPASDGKVYFTVSSHVGGQSARIFEFNPEKKTVREVWRVDRLLPPNRCVAQGKIHSPLAEWNGRLLVSTHTSWYTKNHFDEITGLTQKPYPGGRVFTIDPRTGKGWSVAAPFRDARTVAVVGDQQVPMDGQGIIASAFDAQRNLLYVSSWPGALLARVELRNGRVTQLGPRQQMAEIVPAGAPGYQRVQRTLAMDDSGNVYGADGQGKIWRCGPDSTNIFTLKASLDDATRVATPQDKPWLNTWRTIVWDNQGKVFYGVHWGTSWLFRFDPARDNVRPLVPWRSRQMLRVVENPDGAQLGLALGPGHVLYGLVHAPGSRRGMKRAVHLVTYDIDRAIFRDHGYILGPDDKALLFAESCAVTPNGDVYTVGWMDVGRELRHELAWKRGFGPAETKSLPYLMALVRIPAEQVGLTQPR